LAGLILAWSPWRKSRFVQIDIDVCSNAGDGSLHKGRHACGKKKTTAAMVHACPAREATPIMPPIPAK
jgi:hypothetical protein